MWNFTLSIFAPNPDPNGLQCIPPLSMDSVAPPLWYESADPTWSCFLLHGSDVEQSFLFYQQVCACACDMLSLHGVLCMSACFALLLFPQSASCVHADVVYFCFCYAVNLR